MKNPIKLNKKLLFSIVLMSAVMLFLLFNPLSDTIDLKTIDFRFAYRGDIEKHPDIIILKIDDPSFKYFNRRWPWSRTLIAGAIERLSRARAKVIGLDIMLSEKGFTDIEDEMLKKAVKNKPRIVYAMKFGKNVDSNSQTDYIDAPLPQFDEDLSRSAFVNFFFDADGFVRSFKVAEKFQDQYYFPFAFKAASVYLNQPLRIKDDRLWIGDRNTGLDPSEQFLINYAGSGGSFPSVSFYKLFEKDFDKRIFRNKIVLIGAYFKESHDHFPTPFYQGDGMYGVEIHANGISTLLNANHLKRVPAVLQWLFLIGLLSLTLYVTMDKTPVFGLFFTLLLVLLFTLFSIFLFNRFQIILSHDNPIPGMVLIYFGALIYHYLVADRDKKRIKTTFGRYVSPKVMDKLIDSGVQLGGEMKEVVLFFSDIRGFTTMSEQMSAEAVVEMLNDYFTEMTDIIFKYDGTWDKYIGDAILAFFGAPAKVKDPEKKAVSAVLEMRERLEKLNAKREARGESRITVGMALHKGEVLVGNIGSPRQMGYTVIGDAVNVCSRIESLTKQYKHDILISDLVYQAVKDTVKIETMEPIVLKGKSEKTLIHKLIGRK